MTNSLGRGLIRARLREPIRELIQMLNNLNDASGKHHAFQLLTDIYELREDLDTLIRAERDDETPPEVLQLEDTIGDVTDEIAQALNGDRKRRKPVQEAAE